jgi:hypothetical protein
VAGVRGAEPGVHGQRLLVRVDRRADVEQQDAPGDGGEHGRECRSAHAGPAAETERGRGDGGAGVAGRDHRVGLALGHGQHRRTDARLDPALRGTVRWPGHAFGGRRHPEQVGAVGGRGQRAYPGMIGRIERSENRAGGFDRPTRSSCRAGSA